MLNRIPPKAAEGYGYGYSYAYDASPEPGVDDGPAGRNAKGRRRLSEHTSPLPVVGEKSRH